MATKFPPQGARIIQAILGYSSGTTFYTVVPGTFVYIGTDGTGVANRAVPCTTISSHMPVGCIYDGDSTDIENFTKNGEVSIILFPFMANTDNVASGAEPEAAADKLVYLLDAGTLSDTDTNSSGWALGQCVNVNTNNDEPYLINFSGPIKTA